MTCTSWIRSNVVKNHIVNFQATKKYILPYLRETYLWLHHNRLTLMQQILLKAGLRTVLGGMIFVSVPWQTAVSFCVTPAPNSTGLILTLGGVNVCSHCNLSSWVFGNYHLVMVTSMTKPLVGSNTSSTTYCKHIRWFHWRKADATLPTPKNFTLARGKNRVADLKCQFGFCLINDRAPHSYVRVIISMASTCTISQGLRRHSTAQFHSYTAITDTTWKSHF